MAALRESAGREEGEREGEAESLAPKFGEGVRVP